MDNLCPSCGNEVCSISQVWSEDKYVRVVTVCGCGDSKRIYTFVESDLPVLFELLREDEELKVLLHDKI